MMYPEQKKTSTSAEQIDAGSIRPGFSTEELLKQQSDAVSTLTENLEMLYTRISFFQSPEKSDELSPGEPDDGISASPMGRMIFENTQRIERLTFRVISEMARVEI